MKLYRAVEGDRLDIIAFKAYGSVEPNVMAALLEENEHLLENSIIDVGEIVNLPDVETKEAESSVKALW